MSAQSEPESGGRMPDASACYPFATPLEFGVAAHADNHDGIGINLHLRVRVFVNPRKRTLPGDSCTRSERWRCAVTADAPRTTLKRSIGQFNSNDEDRSAGFKICLIS